MTKKEKLNKLSEKVFKRVIGVKRETYNAMLEEYIIYKKNKELGYGQGGRKAKLSYEEQLLLMLGYYREYRTLEHIGFEYGVSESTALRTVREVEEALIKSKKFSLPSKRELYKSDTEIEFIVVDVTEMPIQRPKKNKRDIIQGRKKDIQ